MLKNKKTEHRRIEIFTTGAHLQSFLYTCPDTGKKQWRWLVIGFEDDSFYNGKYIDIWEYADKEDRLIKPPEKED